MIYDDKDLALTNISKVGFKEWAHTHYEVVFILEEIIIHYDPLPRVLEDVLNKDYVSAIYDLSIEITNEFVHLYENKDWDGDWTTAIRKFINLKLL
jgi:hypothetical protein